MRVLCVDWAGKVRSKALANLLNIKGHQACCFGLPHARAIREASVMADIVVVTDQPPDLLDRVKVMVAENCPVVVMPIGKAAWQSPWDTDLVSKLSVLLNDCDWLEKEQE